MIIPRDLNQNLISGVHYSVIRTVNEVPTAGRPYQEGRTLADVDGTAWSLRQDRHLLSPVDSIVRDVPRVRIISDERYKEVIVLSGGRGRRI